LVGAVSKNILLNISSPEPPPEGDMGLRKMNLITDLGARPFPFGDKRGSAGREKQSFISEETGMACAMADERVSNNLMKAL